MQVCPCAERAWPCTVVFIECIPSALKSIFYKWLRCIGTRISFRFRQKSWRIWSMRSRSQLLTWKQTAGCLPVLNHSVFLCKGGHPSSQTPQDAPNLSHLITCWNQDMFHNSDVLWWKGSNPGLFLHWFILKRIKYESCHSEVVKKSQFEGQIGNKPKSFSFLNFMQTSGSLVVLGRPLLGF